MFLLLDIIHRDLKLDNILLAEPIDGEAYNIKVSNKQFCFETVF